LCRRDESKISRHVVARQRCHWKREIIGSRMIGMNRRPMMEAIVVVVVETESDLFPHEPREVGKLRM
jgi:hypothetical protein